MLITKNKGSSLGVITRIFLVILFFPLPRVGAWPEVAPRTLNFEEASHLALSANPDLLTLRYQEEAQRYRSRQALAPNNPVFNVAKNDVPGFGLNASGASTVYSLNYTLGFPGKSFSQSSASFSLAESLREQALAKEIDILVALSNVYILLTADEILFNFLNEEELKAEQIVNLLDKKYSAAQAAQADLLNARVVVANLKHDILDNRNDHDQLITQFRNLIKKPNSDDYLPLIPESIAIPKLKKTFPELTELMLKNRHQLRSAKKQVDASSSALTNATLTALPDFQLTASMNVYNVPTAAPNNGLTRDYSFGAGIAVPIFFPFNELSGIQAASRDKFAAESQEESQRLQALADLRTAFTTYNSAQKAVDNFENLVIPASKASYELTRTAYSLANKADFFVLNDARKNWVQAQKDLLAKQVLAAQSFNQIVQQVGCNIVNGDGPHACH